VVICVLTIWLCWTCCASGQVASYLTKGDVERLTAALKETKRSDNAFDNISHAYSYAAVVKDSTEICDYLQAQQGADPSSEALYLSIGAAHLSGCSKKPKKTVIKVLENAVLKVVGQQKEGPLPVSALAELFYAATPLAIAGRKGEIEWKTVWDLTVDLLYEHTGKESAAVGFSILANIFPVVDRESIGVSLKNLPSVLSKALQAEDPSAAPAPSPFSADKRMSDIKVAALLVEAFFKLAPEMHISGPIPPAIIEDLDYLVAFLRGTRVSADIGHAYMALKAAANTQTVTGVSFAPPHAQDIKDDTIHIKLSVCGLLGAEVGGISVRMLPAPITQQQPISLERTGSCVYEGAVPTAEGKKASEIIGKNPAVKFGITVPTLDKGSTEYTLVRSLSARANVRVSKLTVTSSASKAALYEYKAPSKAKGGKGTSELPASPLDSLTPIVAIDDTQTLTFTAALEDALTGEPLTPHQVALLFELNKPDQKDTPLPIYRPRQQMMDKGAAGRFTLTVDLNGDKRPVPAVDGVYYVKMLIGDANLYESINWRLGGVRFKFSAPLKTATVPKPDGTEEIVLKSELPWRARPLIHHQFNPPPPSPNPLIPLVALVLCTLVPVGGLVWAWGRVPANMACFPKPTTESTHFIYAVLFQVLLVSEAGLLFWFWLTKSIVTFVKILVPLTFVAVVVGNQVLSHSKTVRARRAEGLAKKTE